jgi:hypothetical protein
MKTWQILCLLGCVNELNAKHIDAADSSENREERSAGIGVLSHFNKGMDKEESLKKGKAELASFPKETRESALPSKEEVEKPEPYMIVVTTDKLSPPGRSVPKNDPNVINELDLSLFPEKEIPWWERWWNGLTEWLFDNNS